MMRIEKNVVIVIGISAITLMECIAMWKGIDGQLLATAFGVIAGLVGYLFGKTKGGKEWMRFIKR